jgi:hypothetical protein
MAATRVCPKCGKPIPPREGPGRPRVYCEDPRCRWRANQRTWRAAHPLGWRFFADTGLPDTSLLAMLEEAESTSTPSR